MESSHGLLGGCDASTGGGRTGSSSSEQTAAAKMEDDFMGREAELDLGLSLGNRGGGGAVVKGKGCAWGEYGRILTAMDFPNGFSSGRAGVNVGAAGTKREISAAAAADGVDEGSASAAVSQVVGWPPVRTYRMNTLFSQTKTSNAENHDKGVVRNEKKEKSNKKTNHGNENNEAECLKETRGRLGFVKVNMDGFPIGRKVDLSAHKSYETLAKMLVAMFFNPAFMIRGGKEQSIQSPKLLDGSSEFVLTYEDRDGDWMLVGDVPWGMFVNTAKRLRIMRTCETNGLAQKLQERDEKEERKPM